MVRGVNNDGSGAKVVAICRWYSKCDSPGVDRLDWTKALNSTNGAASLRAAVLLGLIGVIAAL